MTRFLSITCVLAITTITLAEEPQRKPAPEQIQRLLKLGANGFLRQYDKNKDGKVTKQELPPLFRNGFERADRNNSKALELREVQGIFASLRRRFAKDLPKNNKPSANAQQRAAQMLRFLDKNKDGKLAKSETRNRLQQNFARLDTNKDGFLDRAELARSQYVNEQPKNNNSNANVQQRVAQMLRFLDKNKDGKLAKNETRNGMQQNFARLDTNKDGFLDREELARIVARAAQFQRNRDRPNRSQPLEFDNFDLNADGRLTKEECARTPLAAKFAELDKDKSGKIDPKEFEAIRPQRRDQ